MKVSFTLSEVWEKGGEGGLCLADEVIFHLEHDESHFKSLYGKESSIREKIDTIAKEIYGAARVSYSKAAERQINKMVDLGLGNMPVCIAKTQYSLSDDEKALGAPKGFTLNVREVYPSTGAGFIVALTGSVMTMPGLPKIPSAEAIDVDKNGKITGLF